MPMKYDGTVVMKMAVLYCSWNQYCFPGGMREFHDILELLAESILEGRAAQAQPESSHFVFSMFSVLLCSPTSIHSALVDKRATGEIMDVNGFISTQHLKLNT